MWSWRTLAHMITPRGRPGVAPLDDTGQRILVAGGWTEPSEIFKAPKNKQDLGQLTLAPLPHLHPNLNWLGGAHCE